LAYFSPHSSDKIFIFPDKKAEKAIFAIAFSAARRVIIITYYMHFYNSFNFTNFLYNS